MHGTLPTGGLQNAAWSLNLVFLFSYPKRKDLLFLS